MQIEQEAKLLTAESKPYEISGNSGVSHKIRLNIAGEIYVCKSTAEQVAELKPFEGEEGNAVIRIESRKENLSLKLISFEK